MCRLKFRDFPFIEFNLTGRCNASERKELFATHVGLLSICVLELKRYLYRIVNHAPFIRNFAKPFEETFRQAYWYLFQLWNEIQTILILTQTIFIKSRKFVLKWLCLSDHLRKLHTNS